VDGLQTSHPRFPLQIFSSAPSHEGIAPSHRRGAIRLRPSVVGILELRAV
jgi:hypothetical protein